MLPLVTYKFDIVFLDICWLRLPTDAGYRRDKPCIVFVHATPPSDSLTKCFSVEQKTVQRSRYSALVLPKHLVSSILSGPTHPSLYVGERHTIVFSYDA